MDPNGVVTDPNGVNTVERLQGEKKSTYDGGYSYGGNNVLGGSEIVSGAGDIVMGGFAEGGVLGGGKHRKAKSKPRKKSRSRSKKGTRRRSKTRK
jgi:hypothetical protein